MIGRKRIGLPALVTGLFFLLFAANATAQTRTVNGSLGGLVADGQSGEKMQYVNVAVLSPKDSSMVNGVITDADGKFEIRALSLGKYLVKFSFIGYKDSFKPVEVKAGNTDMGTILLNASSEMLEGVEVVAERQMMEYKLDKRVMSIKILYLREARQAMCLKTYRLCRSMMMAL